MKSRSTSRSQHGPRVPFDRSYWVSDPDLLAGCYPGDLDPYAATAKLRGLAAAGVKTVINLMEPDEVGHGGTPFNDYESQIGKLGVRVERHAIPDLGILSPSGVAQVLDAIDSSIGAGDPVYVHCWGGRGRTGMIVGCWLVRHGVCKPEAAIASIGVLRWSCPDSHLASPETPAQNRVVEGWKPGR